MTKKKGKAKREPCHVQTKRSPKNAHRWEKQVGHAVRLLSRAKFFKVR